MRINPSIFQSVIDSSRDIYRDYINIKNKVVSKQKDEDSVFETIEEQTPLYGKIAEVNNKVQDKNYIPATGLVSLAVLNGPEDVRDIVEIWKQFQNEFKPTKSWTSGYDNKYAQHPYSFFRGTILSDVLNPYSEDCPNPEWAKRIIKADKTLWDTKLGEWFREVFDIKIEKIVTNINRFDYSLEFPQKVHAEKIKTTNKFADITARAMLRTPVLGVGALALIEASDVIHEVKNGKNFFEEASKSALTFGATLISTGVLGAIGAKHYGATGSLVGTTLGALTGVVVDKTITSSF